MHWIHDVFYGVDDIKHEAEEYKSERRTLLRSNQRETGDSKISQVILNLTPLHSSFKGSRHEKILAVWLFWNVLATAGLSRS